MLGGSSTLSVHIQLAAHRSAFLPSLLILATDILGEDLLLQWLPLRHTASLYDLNFDATLRSVNRELTTSRFGTCLVVDRSLP